VATGGTDNQRCFHKQKKVLLQITTAGFFLLLLMTMGMKFLYAVGTKKQDYEKH